jgi:nicotinate-nucleotide adenylyltransferase
VIGLFGGSFDPVHLGHLQLAHDAFRELGLAELRFLPTGQAWQKNQASATDDRVAMLRLALAGHPEYRLDCREIERPGPSYTIDTLEELRRDLGPECALVWLLGYDQMLRLDTWHRWTDLLSLAHLAYVQRPGHVTPLPAPVRELVRRHQGPCHDLNGQASGMIVTFQMQESQVSSTGIRQLFATHQPQLARTQVAPAVFSYIEHHSLYLSL